MPSDSFILLFCIAISLPGKQTHKTVPALLRHLFFMADASHGTAAAAAAAGRFTLFFIIQNTADNACDHQDQYQLNHNCARIFHKPAH